MVYVLVLQYERHDPEKYQLYVDKVVPTIEQFGGSVLAVDDNVTTLEGDWGAKRVVILSFPSATRARQWYESPQYKAIKHLRTESVESEMFFIHGFGEGTSAAVH